MVATSEQSIKRFIKLFLSLNAPAYLFHQTLTTRQAIADPAVAKRSLKKLLDVIHKKIAAVSLYVEEEQARGAVHYHMLIYVFDGNALPADKSKAEAFMRRLVFSAWNKIHGNELFRGANKLEAHEKGDVALEYFLKGVTVRQNAGGATTRTVNWWGYRNRDLIRANSLPVSSQNISERYRRFFSEKLHWQTRETVLARSTWTVADVHWLRQERHRIGLRAWEQFKQLKTDSTVPVSDWQFANYLNSVQNGRKSLDGLTGIVCPKNLDADNLL